jgi:hypothetical protein
MTMLKLLAVAGAVALASASPGAAFAATIADYSFESPAGVGGFDYNPTVTGVVFTGDAGVASGAGFDPVPDGVQNAFLQSTGSSGAQIDISVAGLTAGNVYSFSYFDDQRAGYGVNTYTVSFDGSTIASYSPAAAGWTARTTGTFTALGSSGTLTFAAPLQGYDNDAGIDDITLNGAAPGVPEPTAWALMLIGLGGLGAATRARRGPAVVGV